MTEQCPGSGLRADAPLGTAMLRCPACGRMVDAVYLPAELRKIPDESKFYLRGHRSD